LQFDLSLDDFFHITKHITCKLRDSGKEKRFKDERIMRKKFDECCGVSPVAELCDEEEEEEKITFTFEII
jgi:hypothetical protein